MSYEALLFAGWNEFQAMLEIQCITVNNASSEWLVAHNLNDR